MSARSEDRQGEQKIDISVCSGPKKEIARERLKEIEIDRERERADRLPRARVHA